MDDWEVTSSAPDTDWTPVGAPTPAPAGDDWAVASQAPIEHRTSGQRFSENFVDAFQRNPSVAAARNAFINPVQLTGGAQIPDLFGLMPGMGTILRSGIGLGSLASRAIPFAKDVAPNLKATETARRQAYAEHGAEDPFYTAPGGFGGKAAAGGATLGGQFLGALTDPVNWASMGKGALGRILSQGAINAGGDVATQAADVKAGIQKGWEPVQTVAAGAFGAGLGGAMEGVGHFAPRLLKDAGDAFASYQRGTSSHADVWNHLISQESGGNQAAVSSKGAGGVAQLMPDTAKMVAKKIGQPELADVAFENTPEGAAANEKLGQAYYDQMLAEFGGNHVLAAAAYNAGPGRARAWVRAYGHPDLIGNDAFVSKIPFSETKNYVQNVARDYLDGAVPPPRAANDVEAPTEAPDAGAPAPPVEPSPIDAEIKRRAEEAKARAAAPEEPAAPEPAAAQPAEDIPIPEKPTQATDNWEPAAAPQPLDMRDLALDHLRSGKEVKIDQGPTLMRALLENGGLRDDGGGELGSLDLEATKGRLGKMLVRKKSGMSLEEAAGWAQDHGFLRGQQYEGDGYGRASASDLMDALHNELNGRPHYAKEDPHGQELQAHVTELEEIVHHLGLDPKTMDNATIKAAIDEYFNGHGEGYDEPQGERFGLGGPRELGDSAGPDARLPQQLASTKGLLFGQRNASAIPAPDPANVAPITGVRDLARGLVDALDLTHRQGRIGMRNALGTYNRKSGVIRTLGMQELNVLSHEAGHAMEFTHKYPSLLQAMKAHAARLKQLDYDPKLKRRHEGFAEFVRLYMTNPEMAKQVAPGFYDDFERAMAKDAPKVATELKRIQNAYEGYQTSPSVAVVNSMVVDPPKMDAAHQLNDLAARKGIKVAIGELFSEAYRGMVDRLDPVNRAEKRLIAIKEKNTGAPVDLKTTESFYRALRSAPGAASAGHMDLTNGVAPYHSLTPEGPSLSDAIAEALGKGTVFKNWSDKGMQEFGSYLAARRMAAEHGRYARGELATKPALEPEVWHQAIEDFDTANPTWRSAADKVYQWTNNLWKKRMEGGLITPEQYEAGIADHDDYVPVFRDVSDKHTAALMGARGGSAGKNIGGVKRFTGESERAIINPLYSLMEQAYQLNTHLAFNDAGKMLDDFAESAGPDGGAIAERIPSSEIRGQKTSVKEVLQNAIDQGVLSQRDELTLSDALADLDEGNPKATVFRRGEINEKGEPILHVWKDGKPIALRLPDGAWGKQMMEAFSNMNTPIQSTMLNMMAVPAQMLRFGVTAHPQFFLANTIRDQLSAFINTDVGYKPFASQLRGLGHELSQSDLTRIYNTVGGEIGGAQTASMHAARAEHDLNAIRKAGYQVRRFGSLEGLAQFTELSETGTRLGVFQHAMERAKREGLSDWEAAKEAEYQARDYMDFDRRGGWGAMQVAVRVVPFLNAGLQALDKARRVGGGIMKARDVAKALTGGPPVSAADKRAYAHALKFWGATSALAASGLALRAMYSDDPEYEEVADYLRDTHWVVPLPGGYFGAIPKPFELAALSNIAERSYEGIFLKDSSAWKRLATGLGTLFIPAHDTPIIGVPFQLASNEDAFGAPIVPENLRGVEPEDQVGPRTSELAKTAGKFFGASPIKLDYIAKAVTGSIGRDVIEGTDKLFKPNVPKSLEPTDTFVAGRFIKDWSRGSTSSKKFWDLISEHGGKYDAAANSFHMLYNSGNPGEAMAKLKAMDPEARAYTLVREFNSGPEKLVHPLIREARSAGVYSDLIKDLQQGNIRGVDLKPIQLTPQERTDALKGLNHAAVAEKRNALIDADVPGWENKKLMDTDHYLAEVPAPVRQALTVRMAIEFKDPRLADRRVWAPSWGRLKTALAGPNLNLDALAPAMEAKRTKGRPGMERQFRETTPVQ